MDKKLFDLATGVWLGDGEKAGLGAGVGADISGGKAGPAVVSEAP